MSTLEEEIEELRKKIKDTEKRAQKLKEKLVICEEEKKTYENEVTVERRQILKISCEIDKNRTKINKMKKDKLNNSKKLSNLNLQIEELQKNFRQFRIFSETRVILQ